MKYILKKDLPFAKAGETISYLVNDGLTIRINNRYCDICLANKDEWIEEVKPREWWITEHRNEPVGITTRLSVSDTKPNACLVTECETFKVREVEK